MASYGIQVQMYIDDKPTGRVFNHSTISSTISALYPNVDKTCSESGGSIVLTSGSVRIMSAAVYFDTNEAHFSGSLPANKISAGSIDAEVASVKTTFAVRMLIGNEWTTVGYVGAATGIDASGNTTRGAVLKSVDGNSYVIATNAGVRMQQGNTGLWIADNAISYRIGCGSVTPLGYAVFS